MELSAIIAQGEGLCGMRKAVLAVWAKKCDSLPCVIVTKKARKRAIMAEIRRLLPDAAVMEKLEMDGGKDPASRKVFERDVRLDWLCMSDILVCDHREAMFWARSAARDAKTVIIDEAQQLGPLEDGSWAQHIYWAAVKAPYRIFVTPQSIADRPMRFYYALYLLALRKFRNMRDFGMKFCDPEPTDFAPGGFAFNGSSNTEELLELASDIMIRLKADEVLEEETENTEEA